MSRVLQILFNTDMVWAILDGRKTVTRRPAKKIPVETYRVDEKIRFLPFHDTECKEFVCHWGGYQPDTGGFVDGTCVVIPPYQPGDILYVRETWQYIDFAGEENGYVYKASENGAEWEKNSEGWTWRPSIHMPKEAARIWLKVTDIWVERLQEMKPVDVIKEGSFPDCWDCLSAYGESGNQCCYQTEDECSQCDEVMMEWEKLWNSTIKKSGLDCYSWDANPWVWVIEFEQCEKPKDGQA